MSIEAVCVELLHQCHIKPKLVLTNCKQICGPYEILHLSISFKLYAIQKFKRQLQIWAVTYSIRPQMNFH